MIDKKRVFLLELNEFNLQLLESGARELDLKNLQKLLAFSRIQTVTKDAYESDFLEPWVQWVSIHTGVDSSKHKIKHLGDLSHLRVTQLWEELSERGITSGVWGAMNASRGRAELAKFFLPDPWTASENAYSEELQALLDPIRYLSTNYLNRSNKIFLKKLKGIFRLFRANGLVWAFLKELLYLSKNLLQYGCKSFVFISIFDYLSTLLFVQYKKRYDPDFSILFLNSLAHLQHHHWKQLNPMQSPPLVYGLRYIDKILGVLFDAIEEGEVFFVANALSQKNTSEEKPWILYRQKDQKQFLDQLNIAHTRVESLMTHDAHIYFASEKMMQLAKKALSNLSVFGQKLFLVEESAEDRNKLFYRIAFTDEIPAETMFLHAGVEYRFFDLFQVIVKRTGKHIPTGIVLVNQKSSVEQMPNHELFHTIVGYYEKKSSDRR